MEAKRRPVARLADTACISRRHAMAIENPASRPHLIPVKALHILAIESFNRLIFSDDPGPRRIPHNSEAP
jgi:hypothetical protein